MRLHNLASVCLDNCRLCFIKVASSSCTKTWPFPAWRFIHTSVVWAKIVAYLPFLRGKRRHMRALSCMWTNSDKSYYTRSRMRTFFLFIPDNNLCFVLVGSCNLYVCDGLCLLKALNRIANSWSSVNGVRKGSIVETNVVCGLVQKWPTWSCVW